MTPIPAAFGMSFGLLQRRGGRGCIKARGTNAGSLLGSTVEILSGEGVVWVSLPAWQGEEEGAGLSSQPGMAKVSPGGVPH